MREIAKALQRSVSTISDELKRNQVKNRYDPKKANHKAYVRRKYSKYQGMRIVESEALRGYVEEKLWDEYSPQQISGRIRKKEKNLPYVSKNTVYRYLSSPYGRVLEAYRQKKKYRYTKRKKSAPLTERIFIDERPKIIQEKKRIGDMEGDFIVSGKSGKGSLLTVRDRKSRVIFIEKILPVTIAKMEEAFLRIKKRFPELLTMTLDNDILFRHHKRLEQLLDIKIYFYHPYHSWEKGSIEEGNRQIRRYIPKGSDISRYSTQKIFLLEQKLNNRPLKCLDYETPAEMLQRYRSKQKKS